MAKKILIADDSSVSREFINDMFLAVGYETVQACDGREALDLVKKEKFDCVVVDYHMPDVDGFEVCRTIREDENLKNLPVIMITAMEGMDIKKKAFEAGVSEFFTKDSMKNFLIKYVDGLFETKETQDISGRVLVVEPSRLIRRLVCNFLISANIETLEAQNSQEALDVIENDEIDMVVTALVVPGAPDVGFVKIIREKYWRQLAIIVMSSIHDQASITNAFWEGANDYITKPFQRDEFLARVYSHLEIGKMQRHLVRTDEKFRKEMGQRKAAEEKLGQQKKELDRFVHMVSQDFQEPLSKIATSVEFLEKDSSDKIGEEGTRHLSEINKRIEHMMQLVKNILNLFKDLS